MSVSCRLVAIFSFLTVLSSTAVCFPTEKDVAETPAAGTVQGCTYQRISEESYIFGPKLTPDDFKGKVIFFEYWGLNCPPCIASLPHLQEIWEKHEKSGKFLMIGAHSQGRNDEAVKKLLSEKKVTFPIYQFAKVVEAPCPGGIPYAVLIDHHGAVVEKGHPSKLYDSVDALVKAAPDLHPILGTLTCKVLKSQAAKLIPGKNIESVIKTIEKTSEMETPAGEEARQIIKAYQVWLEKQKTEIKNLLEASPSLAMEKITVLKLMMPSMTDFNESFNKLKANPELNQLLQIRKTMSTIELKFRKKNKPSKATAAEFERLKKRVENLKDPTLKQDIDTLNATLESLIKESSGDA